MLEVLDRADEFDVIHSHLEWSSVILARATSVPVRRRRSTAGSTCRGRARLLEPSAPDGLVAISESQAGDHPDVAWTIVHNGLTLDGRAVRAAPLGRPVFVGRVDAGEGDRRGDRDRRAERPPAADRGQGRPDARRARLQRRSLPAGPAGGRVVGRVPRRAVRRRPRRAVRLELRRADAGLVAGAVRARRDRGARLRHAGPRPPRRRPRRDHPRRRRRLLRRRRHPARVPGRPGRGARPRGIRASVIDRFSATRMADGYEALYRRIARGRASDARASAAVAGRPIGVVVEHCAAVRIGSRASRSPPERPRRSRRLAAGASRGTSRRSRAQARAM